ncbi:hypothetical protein WG66_012400 [Moniliophthora roreri]|nr:hypothetical protein WG66_012400 [Moniliophthora roreri]
MGMSPASIYEHNLKVLRRRDPSIVSIFDQFSHVCVYHHNGEKWEKHGYEGSMFLYERDAYPPYGFYILNRMGMEDYIQRIYPEDDIGAHGSYLMLRSYPEFTKRRLAHLPQGYDKFSPEYAFNRDQVTAEEKRRFGTQVIGLWMFTTDAREPMIDVMIRLHSYIKRHVPYPEEFRYGPDRPPPPPNPHLRNVSASPDRTASAASMSASSNSSVPANLPSGDLAALLAKLSSSTSTGSPLLSFQTPATHEPQRTLSRAATRPSNTSKMSVNDLFAALQGETPTQTPQLNRNVTDSAILSIGPGAAAAKGTGNALLDSIFASAASSASAPTASTSTSTTLATLLAGSAAVTSQTTTTTAAVNRPSHARASSTASVSTNSSRSTRQRPEKIVIHSPNVSTAQAAAKPQEILALTQEVVDGLLDGSGVGRGSFGSLAFAPVAAAVPAEEYRQKSQSKRVNGDSVHQGMPELEPIPFEESQASDDDEDEILELDFADTHALDDMAAFDRRERERDRKKGKAKETTPIVEKQVEHLEDGKAPATVKDSNGMSPIDMLFSRSQPAVVQGEGSSNSALASQTVSKGLVNGFHKDATTVKESVKESLLDAIFASAAQPTVGNGSIEGELTIGAIRGKDDLVRAVERLVKQDEAFVDALWDAFELREQQNSHQVQGSNGQQKKTRTRRRQGRNASFGANGMHDVFA